MINKNIKLIRVQKKRKHIEFLYDLLKKKKFFISHTNIPSYEEHRIFVENHPYRKWFLIKFENYNIGSIYLNNDNSIGINFLENFQHLIKESLEIVLENYNPLPELKSIRNGSYHINIANGDLKLLHEIKKLNIKKLQTTYVLK